MQEEKGILTKARSGPTPVGGKLVDRVLAGAVRDKARDLAARLPKLTLTLDQQGVALQVQDRYTTERFHRGT